MAKKSESVKNETVESRKVNCAERSDWCSHCGRLLPRPFGVCSDACISAEYNALKVSK